MTHEVYAPENAIGFDELDESDDLQGIVKEFAYIAHEMFREISRDEWVKAISEMLDETINAFHENA